MNDIKDQRKYEREKIDYENDNGKDVFLNVFTFFLVTFLAISSSFAHQPVLNTEDEISKSKPYIIKDPEISKAIYSTLNGANHFY